MRSTATKLVDFQQREDTWVREQQFWHTLTTEGHLQALSENQLRRKFREDNIRRDRQRTRMVLKKTTW